jgi:hypothetical protein
LVGSRKSKDDGQQRDHRLLYHVRIIIYKLTMTKGLAIISRAARDENFAALAKWVDAIHWAHGKSIYANGARPPIKTAHQPVTRIARPIP